MPAVPNGSHPSARRPRPRRVPTLLPISLVLCVLVSSAFADSEAVFLDRIAPIFERNCLRCHGDEPKGGLALVDRASAFRGGDSGRVIEPGHPEDSSLLESVSGAKPSMPKGSPPLSADEVESLRRWIADGAAWPATARLRNRQFEGSTWWSLQPLRAPSVPEVDPSWSDRIRNPIDAFILQGLRPLGLAPSPQADRVTLIRRLAFDLVGLPPSPEEIDSFLRDDRPQAYERLVDRLLDSPRYGERWARHWLDVVHFGETHGYDKDKPRPNAWPYRDYVIRALNADLPYGQFLQQQVAGDVLSPGTRDGIEALGFLSAGPWDFIGHAEVPETKIDGRVARHLDRDDMVTNTIQTFASLTVQCAQCHDHKFDPIGQEDYYSLQAVFAAIDRTDRPYDADPRIAERRSSLQERHRRLAAERDAVTTRVVERAGEPLRELDRNIAELRKTAASGVQQGVEFGYHSLIAAKPDELQWVQLNLAEPMDVRDVVLRPCHDDFAGIGSGFGFPVRYRIESASDAGFTQNVRLLIDQATADVVNPRLTPQAFALEVKEAGRIQFLRITVNRLAPRSNDYIFALAEVELRDAQGKNLALGAKVTALDSIEAPPRWRKENLTDGKFPIDRDASQVRLDELVRRRDQMWTDHATPAEQKLLEETNRELGDLAERLRQLPPQSVAYVGAVHTGEGAFRGTGHEEGRPRPIWLLDRGNVEKPVRPVGPGALSAIGAIPARFELPADAPEGARRAALAHWLSSPQNPLTWRSIVNRVWHYHFGKGLVETPNDFGRNGRVPTHPELLDWLAAGFRDDGQSLKQLHRLIVCSATYRQSSAQSGQAAAVDADNRWLSRMNRRRLEAEAIRDAVLAVSGRLDLTMGGPSFQDFVIEKPEHSPHYEYELADPDDPRIHRRSVYRFIVRSQQQPFMTTLDCADPSMQVDKRNESLSALQALALLNNGFMLTMAGHYAEQLRERRPEASGQVRLAYRECTGREPTADDLAELTAFAQRYGLKNLCRVLFNLNEFVFVD